MSHGFREGILRLKAGSGALAEALMNRLGTTRIVDEEAVSEHDLRDLGILDGRVSPSTVQHHHRPAGLDLTEMPPRSL